MAPLAANDSYRWVPPTPYAVSQETGWNGYGTAGNWSPFQTPGWTCQTYLGFGTAGIAQTYSTEAPAEPEPEPETKPEPVQVSTKNGKVAKVMQALEDVEK